MKTFFILWFREIKQKKRKEKNKERKWQEKIVTFFIGYLYES